MNIIESWREEYKKSLTPLEAFKIIKDTADLEFFLPKEQEFEVIEQALKALEIIKQHANHNGIDIKFNQIYSFNGETYVIDEKACKDFELLKEVLL